MALNIVKPSDGTGSIPAFNEAPSLGGSLPPKPPVLKSSGELAAVIKQIVKEKGDKVVVSGSSIPDVERTPTGVFEFDLASNGGFPNGRYSIVYGPESSGKTNLCLCAIASAQRRPPPCNKAVFVDIEGTFDPKWAAQFGVNVDELIVVKPGFGEEAVDLIDALVHADDVAILVVDSLAVVTSSKELGQSAESYDVGTASILVKRLVNKLAIMFTVEGRRDHRPCVLLINQTRFKIGVMFGDPETIPGGQAMKFNSSFTVRLYGKNKMDKKIHPDLPIFKDTHMVIKKAKVPIRAMVTDYDMVMNPTSKLSVGQSASFNMVKSHLQAVGGIVSVKGGYEVLGVHYSKVGDIEDHYYTDHDFRIKMQRAVLDSLEKKVMLVEATGAAAPNKTYAPGTKVDIMTGEECE